MKFRPCSLALLAFLFAPRIAHAQEQINGVMLYQGSVFTNTGSTGTATAFTGYSGGFVYTDGAFATYLPIPNVPLPTPVPVALMPWTFEPSMMVASFFSIAGFTFDIISSTVTQRADPRDFGGNIQGASLFVRGTGLVSGNGIQPTFVRYNTRSMFVHANGSHHFALDVIARVPEGGLSSLGLLAIACGLLALIPRTTSRRAD